VAHEIESFITLILLKDPVDHHLLLAQGVLLG
jgi:hypothetical protein